MSLNENDTEEKILLGGQVSAKLEIFKLLAQLDVKSGFVVTLLDRLDDAKNKDREFSKLPPEQQVREILMLDGQANFMAACGELTKLAAIVGDTRKSHSSKKLKDFLWNLRQQKAAPQ